MYAASTLQPKQPSPTQEDEGGPGRSYAVLLAQQVFSGNFYRKRHNHHGYPCVPGTKILCPRRLKIPILCVTALWTVSREPWIAGSWTVGYGQVYVSGPSLAKIRTRSMYVGRKRIKRKSILRYRLPHYHITLIRAFVCALPGYLSYSCAVFLGRKGCQAVTFLTLPPSAKSANLQTCNLFSSISFHA